LSVKPKNFFLTIQLLYLSLKPFTIDLAVLVHQPVQILFSMIWEDNQYYFSIIW
jgi:hypothetical protein